MLCITNLDHANAMLYGLPSSTLRKYQTIQNSCAKLILNKNRYLHSSWALKKLPGFHTTKDKHKILTTTFKCITDMAPKYLHDLIMSIKTTHGTISDLTTQAPCYTDQKSSTIPLQHGPSCILHQHYETSYQSSSKIHQPWTSSRRG